MKPLRTVFAVVVAGCVATAVAVPSAVAADDLTADVAAWNLAGFEPIPRERVPRFVEGITYLDPEVIALAEVNEDWIAAEVAAGLTQAGACYKRVILDQSALQNIALLYRCDVSVEDVELVPGSDDGNHRLRKALAARVTVGRFDFVLIAVHLKAGRAANDRTVRDSQVAAIAGYVAAETAGAEKDVVLVGDYNMIPGRDRSNFEGLSPTGFLDFVSSRDLASTFSHIKSSGPGDLLDGYAVSDDHTGEYVEGSLRVFPLHRALGMELLEYREKVSDHLPLIADFVVTVDDD